MANVNPVSFLLNQATESKGAQVVEAPAFSLTKVLAAAAVIVTPIATALVERLKSVNLTASNYVALGAAVLGFLAIASAADVLGRSYASAAVMKVQAEQAGTAQIIKFKKPLDGHRIKEGEDAPIEVLATAYAGEPMFLIKEGDSIMWLTMDKVSIP